MENRSERTWEGDWRKRVMARLRLLGFETVGDFLMRYPGESYFELANRLGNDVAVLQLESLQFGDAQSELEIRKAAMDSLVREFIQHLPERLEMQG